MPNYQILLEGQHVFDGLRRATGEALEAAHGEVVALWHDVEDEAHQLAVEAHLAAKNMVETDEAVTKKAVTQVVQKTDEDLAAEKAAVEKALAAQNPPPADPPVTPADPPVDPPVDPALPATQ